MQSTDEIAHQGGESNQLGKYFKHLMNLNVRNDSKQNENNKQWWQDGVNWRYRRTDSFLHGTVKGHWEQRNANKFYEP